MDRNCAYNKLKFLQMHTALIRMNCYSNLKLEEKHQIAAGVFAIYL